MATKRLYFDLIKSFSLQDVTSCYAELNLLEELGFIIADKDEFKNKVMAARVANSGKNFSSETKDLSEKAIRNLLNSCGTLIFKKGKQSISIIPLRPIGAYLLCENQFESASKTLYTNPIKMFEHIRSRKGFDFDINLIQKHIDKAISESSVIDFAACRKDFEYAKLTDEDSIPFDVCVRFVSANEVLGKEVEVIGIGSDHRIEFFILDYAGHIDVYTACILVKNTPENLPIIQKLIKNFGWQQSTHPWFTEPIDEILSRYNI